MKVILLKDIKGTGKKDQILEVNDGYARNYLLPRKLAVEASSTNLNVIQAKKDKAAHDKEQQRLQAQNQADALNGKTVKLTASSGENGRLFGSVTSKEIADALSEQYNCNIDKKKIVSDNIRALGRYEVELKLYTDVSAVINVEVVAEK